MAAVNSLAVIPAALPGFLVGSVWYSPTLFAKPWMTELGLMN